MKKITKEQINKWNKKFNSLDTMGKRVLIAKDVIAQIKAQRYVASTTYFGIDNYLKEIKFDKSLQKQLPNITCRVCAIGSVFTSFVKYKNKYTVGEVNEFAGVQMADILSDFFDRKTLGLMELAFENFGHMHFDEGGCEFESGILIGHEDEVDENEVCEAKAMYSYDQTETLLKIMNNIIDNKGEFIP